MGVKSFSTTAFGVGGGAASGALCNVYTRNTTTRKTVYSDSTLVTPFTNPVVGDSDGRIGPVYFDDTLELTFQVTTSDGATRLLDVDYRNGTFSATYVQLDQLTLFEQTKTGDGTTTIFVLSNAVADSPYQIDVTIDGLLQPKTSYNVSTDGTDTTVTFSEAPPSGGVIWLTSAIMQASLDVSSGTLITATGASVGLALADIPDWLKPQQLGTVDGTADDVQISAAITAGFANRLREVRLDYAEYAAANTISIADGSDAQYSTQNGLTIAGHPARPFMRLNSSGSPLEDVGTRLKWTGSAGGTVMRINGPATGIHLRDIGINADGASADAAIGLETISLNRSDIDGLTIAGATSVGWRINTSDNGNIAGSSGEYDGTTDMQVRNLAINAPASAIALQLDGYGGRRQVADCALATTANITLSGEQTIDGTLTSATRILVKNQTNGVQNGIYTTGAGAWTRATDYDAGSEVFYTTVYITGGTVSANKRYHCTNATTPTVGTTALTFTQDDNVDPVRWKFSNTFLLNSLTGTVGLDIGFADQHTFDDLFMSFNGSSDGNARSIRLRGVKVSGSNFPQNIRMLHLDSGQSAPIEVDDSISAPGGGHHFGWNTGFDSQAVLGRKEAKYITSYNVMSGDHPRGGWWQKQGPTAGKSYHNVFLNPMMIRQSRGSSGTITNGGFCADNFVFGFDGSVTGTWTLTALSPGDTTSDGWPVYKLVIDITAASGNTFFFLGQRIRRPGIGANLFEGCATTLSAYWRQTAGSAQSLGGARYEQNWGTGGSPSATGAGETSTLVGYQTALLSSTWKALDYILQLQSTSGKTRGTNGDDRLQVFFKLPLNAVCTLEMMMPQYELGRGFSCFDQRDPAYDEVMCSRTLRKRGSGLQGSWVSSTNTSVVAFGISFDPPMRATPSVSAASSTSAVVHTPGDTTYTDSGTTAVSSLNLAATGCQLTIAPGGTWSAVATQFRPAHLRTDIFLLSAE